MPEPHEAISSRTAARGSRGGCLSSLSLALVLVAAGGLALVYSGVYDVAATQPHSRAARWVLGTLMERSVRSRAGDVPVPPAESEELLAMGFHHYDEMCAVCHGAPGVERGEIGEGMEPEPPALAEEAGEWTLPEIFWITSQGIKMAGMPAFRPTHSEEELWGISMFVKRLPEMDAAEYARLREEARGEGGGESSGSVPTPTHTH
ncbi:MAG TPA: cytochrome c [Gemmatimonadota bacterium]|nr:cytochrome c [Gemmatimonadota bacterium]